MRHGGNGDISITTVKMSADSIYQGNKNIQTHYRYKSCRTGITCNQAKSAENCSINPGRFCLLAQTILACLVTEKTSIGPMSSDTSWVCVEVSLFMFGFPAKEY
jgi:hypothetical protein